MFLLFFQNILSRVAGCRLESAVGPKARIEVKERTTGTILSAVQVQQTSVIRFAIASEPVPKWRIETGASIQ